jgi:hypothetical protein
LYRTSLEAPPVPNNAVQSKKNLQRRGRERQRLTLLLRRMQLAQQPLQLQPRRSLSTDLPTVGCRLLKLLRRHRTNLPNHLDEVSRPS